MISHAGSRPISALSTQTSCTCQTSGAYISKVRQSRLFHQTFALRFMPSSSEVVPSWVLPSGLPSCLQQNPNPLCARAHKPVDLSKTITRHHHCYRLRHQGSAIRVVALACKGNLTGAADRQQALNLNTAVRLAPLLSELCHQGCAIKGLLVPAGETWLALPTGNRL